MGTTEVTSVRAHCVILTTRLEERDRSRDRRGGGIKVLACEGPVKGIEPCCLNEVRTHH